jgi:hypothetical protein
MNVPQIPKICICMADILGRLWCAAIFQVKKAFGPINTWERSYALDSISGGLEL